MNGQDYRISTDTVVVDLERDSLTLEVNEELWVQNFGEISSSFPFPISFNLERTHNVFAMVSFLSIRTITSTNVTDPDRIDVSS